MKKLIILLLALAVAACAWATTKPYVSAKDVPMFNRDHTAGNVKMFYLAAVKLKGVSATDTIELGNVTADGNLKFTSQDKITLYGRYFFYPGAESLWVNLSVSVSPESTALYQPVRAPNWEHLDTATSLVTPKHTYTQITDSTENLRVAYQLVCMGSATGNYLATPITLPKGMVASRIYIITKHRVAGKSTDSLGVDKRYLVIERGVVRQ